MLGVREDSDKTKEGSALGPDETKERSASGTCKKPVWDQGPSKKGIRHDQRGFCLRNLMKRKRVLSQEPVKYDFLSASLFFVMRITKSFEGKTAYPGPCKYAGSKKGF